MEERRNTDSDTPDGDRYCILYADFLIVKHGFILVSCPVIKQKVFRLLKHS